MMFLWGVVQFGHHEEETQCCRYFTAGPTRRVGAKHGIPTMSGRGVAGTPRVKVAKTTIQKHARLEAWRARAENQRGLECLRNESRFAATLSFTRSKRADAWR
jgi:hypothetical protein